MNATMLRATAIVIGLVLVLFNTTRHAERPVTTDVTVAYSGFTNIIDLAFDPQDDAALFEAIRAGDAAAVRELLKGDVDLNARNDIGDTPLMAAALYAGADVLKLVLNAGTDVNATNEAGATALIRAATSEEKARLLVAGGANVNAGSQLGNAALILAARKAGNSGTVKLLLDHGADVNATNLYGATALMAATAAEDESSVRLLLDHGADVNARPNMNTDGFIWGGGRTALMWAAFLGNEPLVKTLLERGANVGQFTVVGGALEQAAWGGHTGVARLLLAAGAEVDRRDLIANYTPLHWAASSEYASAALTELLLAHGADANAEGGQPVDNFLGVIQTPLSLARKRGDTPIVRTLLKAGAKNLPERLKSGESVAEKTDVSKAKNVAEAIQRALPPLTKTAEESVATFVRHVSKQDCVSCHQQQLPLTAISLAQSRRLATDRDAAAHQLTLLKKMISSPENGLQIVFDPEPAIFAGYTSLPFSLQHEPTSTATDGLVHLLATIQHTDGRWSWNIPRPPIQASDITATALAVHAIKSFGIPGRRQELDSRVQRARAWLTNAHAETNEQRTHQILGLTWAGEESGAVKKLAEALMREQRDDGGWGQLAGLDSDAYGTGQSLYALMEGARTPPDNLAVRRGIDYLLRTQLADGTWRVRTRTHPFQPPMDSGFPHGKDGWISSAGASWAVMALATSLDPSQTPPTAPAIAKADPTDSPVAATADNVTEPVEFVRDIQPLLERSCVACHGGKRPKGGFAMSNRVSLLKGGNRGEPVVISGKPDASPLIRYVQDRVEDLEMPPLEKRGKFPALTKDEVAKLKGWIAAGAVWPEESTLRPSGK